VARTPIRKFAEQEGVGLSFLYSEVRAKHLVLTKVGSRTFVDDEDAARWRAQAPKVGQTGVAILQAAELRLEELGKAIADGKVDRDVALAKLVEVAQRAGLRPP
jgi:hypothetical protein